MINEIRKIIDAYGKLSYILNKEQKGYCILIFVMSLVAAVFETLGVSVIIPVIQAFVEEDKLLGQPYITPFIDVLRIENSKQAIVWICIGVGLVYLIKNVYSVIYTWAVAKFSNKLRRELAVKVLQTYMNQGYIFFVDNNTSRLIRGISSDVNSVQEVVTSSFSFIIKLLTISCIMIFIFVQTPGMAIWIIFLVALCFGITQIIFRRTMRREGVASREFSYKASQASLEAIQGNKEVLAFDRQEYFVNEYLKNMIEYNKAEVKRAVANVAPNYLIEVICIVGLLCAIVFQIIMTDEAGKLMTQMAIIAVAAFRILPSLGGMLGNVNSIIYNGPGLTCAYDTLQMVKELDGEGGYKRGQEIVRNTYLKEKLEINNISYAYPNTTKNVIDNLSMTIKKGTSIGLIGMSGAGKTTLADIILSLLKPQSGEILIDGINIEKIGREWHHIIGYVPQSIYMVDDSIRRNVAFGIDEHLIDDEKVWKALEMAQMKCFVEGLPDRLNTRVGEWGVQLSGGQRQRIAIARALYGEPDIIVLDEATAALDNETENAVMESIEALQSVKTLIIVAHRLTTIRKCDAVYEIVGGKAIKKNKEEILIKENSV